MSSKKSKGLKRVIFFIEILQQVNTEKMSADNYSNLFET